MTLVRQTAPGKLGPTCSQFYSTDELLSQVLSCDHQISVVRASDRGLGQETFYVILIMDHVEVANAHRIVIEYGACKPGAFPPHKRNWFLYGHLDLL